MAVFTDEQIAEILELINKRVGHMKYIGARYVPIFGRKGEESWEWDNSAPYEPLTIVYHEGNSYTSRQYVPTGIDISSDEFWAQTGNYNAQIEQYRQELKAYNDRINSNTELIKEEADTRTDEDKKLDDLIKAEANTRTDEDKKLEARIKNSEDVLAMLGTAAKKNYTDDIFSASAAIPTAQTIKEYVFEKNNTYSKYSGGTFVAFGDSITKGRYVLPEEAWPAVAAKKLGMTIKNYAVNSAAFTRTGERGVLEQVQGAANDSTDKTNVKLVALAAGVNDGLTEHAASNEVQSKVVSIINLIARTYPNADIVLVNFLQGMFPINGLNDNSSSGTAYINSGLEVYRGIQYGAESANVPVRCINSAFTWGLGQSSWFTSTGPSPWGDDKNADTLHPNVTGNAQYANFFCASLFGEDFYPTVNNFPISATGLQDVLQNRGSCFRSYKGRVMLQGHFTITEDILAAGSIDISMPSWACVGGLYQHMFSAFYNEDGTGKTLIPVRMLAYCDSMSPTPHYTLRLTAVSGGWKTGGRIIIPHQEYPLGAV